VENPEKNIVTPPNIYVNERLRPMFMETIMESLLTYKSLLDEGINLPRPRQYSS
jgi:hypothetical protein